MQYRIRAAAIVVRDNRVLLVKHRNPNTGFEWWVPPGGGVIGGETIYDCAKRETYEETGLNIELGRILYLREFIDLELSVHNLEIFILATSFEGRLTTTNVNPLDEDAHYIKGADFLSLKEMKDLVVFPEILKDKSLSDLASDKWEDIQYLGQQKGYSSHI
jgi:8-oxo-dGTP diphosphatase